jgi:hypothetical protein
LRSLLYKHSLNQYLIALFKWSQCEPLCGDGGCSSFSEESGLKCLAFFGGGGSSFTIQADDPYICGRRSNKEDNPEIRIYFVYGQLRWWTDKT